MYLNKGPDPHHQCKQHGMLISCQAMAAGYLNTAMYKRGSDKKHCCISSTTTQVVSGNELRSQDQVLDKVDTCNYLGRMLYFNDRNWPVVENNLQRARMKWGQFSCMLCQEGANIRTSGRFYMVVVQSVPLFSS